MNLARALVVLLAAAATLAGCEERLRPGFPHRAHLISDHCGGEGQPACPTCASCHDNLRTGDGAPRPSAVDCKRCHEQDLDERVAAITKGSAKRTAIRFDHTRHLPIEAIAGQCVGCHGGITEDGARGDVFPAMADCTGCHDGELERGECTPCHQPKDLRQLTPETFLRHDLGFLRNHGLEAGRRQQVCSQCHAERDCAACHDQGQPLSAAERMPVAVERPLIHRGNFLSHHASEARSQQGTCLQCHEASFCDSCHVRNGVSGNRAGALNPHPIGWVGPDALAPTFHGLPARRDILSCATCHDQGPATNCIRCHRVGGYGGNPHPNGWRSTRSTADSMCRYCHEG